ncbi:MAG: hypothetical protein IKD00_00815 [Candidatus Methanomethylophilaceae archaeon]|nr:hypothetical protein [Candidatus Methanomethylophilaceae archaeon]
MVRILKSRNAIEDGLESIRDFYKDTQVISIKEWNYDDIYNTLQSVIDESRTRPDDIETLIDITTANPLEASTACTLTYLNKVKLYCSRMEGTIKNIDILEPLDLSRFGTGKIRILKLMNETGGSLSVKDVHEMLKKNMKITEKHVRTCMRELESMKLLKNDGRHRNHDSEKPNTRYSISDKGKISYTLYERNHLTQHHISE